MLNDQLGRGRSTTTAIIVLLIQRWMKLGRDAAHSMSMSGMTPRKGRAALPHKPDSKARSSWQIINSCIRCIRNGLEVKRVSLSIQFRSDRLRYRLSTTLSTPLQLISIFEILSSLSVQKLKMLKIQLSGRSTSKRESTTSDDTSISSCSRLT